ncbi:MAG: hypothetical protein GKR89_17460 [Candidatus Latescibacteria bacterium]|nr:hypothetical protein [Candidatus Latescibacterota bacterium]
MQAEQILAKVGRALDILIEVGDQYQGLFPSLIDRQSHRMLSELPPPIPGQRQGDRSHLGSNLIHDEAALLTLYALDKPHYRDAADRYLRRFATHCTDTATGLFPWGEHAYWHLGDDKVGNSGLISRPDAQGGATHDHLRQAPLWLWEKLQQFDSNCVQGFADGLDFHWVEGEPAEYIRHARIEIRERLGRGTRSCDFPRHGGFYIFDWAFAYGQSRRPELVGYIEKMLDYWWPLRDPSGQLLIESRSPETDERFYQTNAPGQTLSLGVSLLEAAPLLEDDQPELARLMRQRAAVYLGGFLAAPHDLEDGIFAITCSRAGNRVDAMPVWGSVYGLWPVSYVALTALCGYRLSGDQGLLGWAVTAGENYRQGGLPKGVAVPAMDAGLGLGLLADLYDITGEERWLQSGLALAGELVGVYCDADLPRGAAGIDWYESQMGPSFLLHGLARIALLALEGPGCRLAADYTAR